MKKRRRPTTYAFDLGGSFIDALAAAIAKELIRPRPIATFLQWRSEAEKARRRSSGARRVSGASAKVALPQRKARVTR